MRNGKRLGVLAGLVSLLSTFAIALAPGTAHAGAIVPCPADYHDVSGSLRALYFYRYTVLSSTPVFYVADGRVLDNGLPYPVEYTLTSQVQTTVKVTVTVGFQAGATTQFSRTVNASIEASRTTMIGQQIKATVPANSRLIAEYGLHTYFIEFGTSMWRWRGGNTCEEWGWYPQTTYAPLPLEGWRLRA